MIKMAEGDTDTREGRNRGWINEWDKGLWDLVYTKPGPVLAKHFEKVTGGRKGLKILVPLCATTYDVIWLCEQGHSVVGADLAESGAQRLFKQYKQTPIIEDVPSTNGKLYKNSSGTFKYYVGDFLQFSADLEGKFDFIWDSMALAVLDRRDRDQYLKVIRSIMGPKCILMLEFFRKTDQSEFPHYFTEEELKGFYGDVCDVEFLDEGMFDMAQVFQGNVIDTSGHTETGKENPETEGSDMKENMSMECYLLRKRE